MKTSSGPAKSMRLNLGCRAKRTSIGSSDTADVLCAAILPTLTTEEGAFAKTGEEFGFVVEVSLSHEWLADQMTLVVQRLRDDEDLCS